MAHNKKGEGNNAIMCAALSHLCDKLDLGHVATSVEESLRDGRAHTRGSAQMMG
jgi:hypothetical protein